MESDDERGRFDEIAACLKTVDEQMCTALDADQLARYVQREADYIYYRRRLAGLKGKGADPKALAEAERMVRGALSDVQTCASALGLNVSSRLKLDLRKPEQDDEDDFGKFE